MAEMITISCDKLEKICHTYDLDYDEILNLINSDLQECSWVHQRKTKEYNKGDKCRRYRMKGCVFCHHHHKGAKPTLSVTLGDNSLSTTRYNPKVGIYEISRSEDQGNEFRTIKLIQGILENIRLIDLE